MAKKRTRDKDKGRERKIKEGREERSEKRVSESRREADRGEQTGR